MPDFTIIEKIEKDTKPNIKSPEKVSKAAIIENGIEVLNELGMNHICKVCIANSGSCCRDCRHLRDGVGCQQRNTSCTAWLCGFQKYLLYEIGQLEEWITFWNQVPGQDFREDFTPDYIFIEKSLSRHTQTMEQLGKALALDLQEMARAHIAIGFILTLREKLDKNIDQLIDGNMDPKKQIRLKRKIKALSGVFYRFHDVLFSYREQLTKGM